MPYRDCAELLNAGIRNTGVHTIVDKNWELPVYCDQDYMGGGKRDFMRTHCEPTFHHNRFKIPLTIYFISVACKPLTTRSLHKRKMADPRICLGFFFVSQVTVFSLKDVHCSAENWQIIFRQFSLLFSQSHADPPSSLSSPKMSVKQIL